MSKETQLDRIERNLINDREMNVLGHRIVYNTKTGQSTNLPECWIDPECLDENGYQVRFEDKK